MHVSGEASTSIGIQNNNILIFPMTDEGDVYNETVDRIKLILVNLCQLKI